MQVQLYCLNLAKDLGLALILHFYLMDCLPWGEEKRAENGSQLCLLDYLSGCELEFE